MMPERVEVSMCERVRTFFGAFKIVRGSKRDRQTRAKTVVSRSPAALLSASIIQSTFDFLSFALGDRTYGKTDLPDFLYHGE